MPAATAWLLGGVKRRTLSTWVEYGIIWLGLLLSITRMTLIVCALQLVLVILVLPRPEWAVGSLSIGVASLLVAFLLVPGLPGFVWDTLTWQTSSSARISRTGAKGWTHSSRGHGERASERLINRQYDLASKRLQRTMGTSSMLSSWAFRG